MPDLTPSGFSEIAKDAGRQGLHQREAAGMQPAIEIGRHLNAGADPPLIP